MPVRKIPRNHRNLTGVLASTKSLGPAQFESTLERDFLTHLEFSSDVQAFEVQPVTIEWRSDNGSRRTYTPDVLISFQKETGRIPWLCEVKYRSDLRENWADLHPKFLKAIRYAKENGWRFRLITDAEVRSVYLDNIRFLLPFRSRAVPPTDVEEIVGHVTAKTEISIQQLLSEVTPDEKCLAEKLPVVWHLLSQHRICTNFELPLTMHSKIWVA
ncbi:heteromeric transposase endonuclease subunit TnsA [Herbaspirillum rubrisubalbicans Os34]|uniref:Heteromeric transposase endonuclease subunit TnsA n=1 Tax=Herbaspirillum rubrisubalbicans Os34 TaxID=1235827 RepID=A0A6M4A042_9BURK|nr:TnsA endonuclease N-terminal domain-containing protein [Herbaspirillum rubrisubalbicans]QJQ03783.1 heteromeric transposase endonuclease subunit TnsA [Herbaspirillum rubrisubalbicans Os34]